MSKKPEKIIIEIPPTPTWDVMKWCVLYNLRRDLMKDPTITIEVMNTLMLKMWSIEDQHPNWKKVIIPSLLPYRKRWVKEIKITPTEISEYTTYLYVKILPL